MEKGAYLRQRGGTETWKREKGFFFLSAPCRRRSFASQVMEKHTGSEMLGEACPGQQVGSAARHNREREDFLEIAPLLTPTIAKKSRSFQRRSELENSRIADSAVDPRGPRGGLRSQQRISTEVTGS